MPSRWSEATQKTNLAEGLAAAALVLGVQGVTSQRFSLDRAFEHAWAFWPHTGRFPQMRVGLDRNDIVTVLDRSERRRAAYTAFWDTQLPATHHQPRLRSDSDTPEDALALIAKGTGIPAEDWLDLTRRWVDEIAKWDENAVQRQS